MDDSQDIARLKKGDIQGLKGLVERYQTKALRTVYLMTQDKMLAEDIVQTAFLRLMDAIHSFDTSRPFEPWFMRVLLNQTRQMFNREKRLLQMPSDEVDEFPVQEMNHSPEYEFDLLENISIVEQALGQLSENHREVIVLRYYLGYSETEISDLIERPLGTVRSRSFYAHKHLRETLTTMYTGDTQ